jgi:hypothetical protein
VGEMGWRAETDRDDSFLSFVSLHTAQWTCDITQERDAWAAPLSGLGRA